MATCTYLGTQIPNLRGLSIDGLHAGIAMHAAGLLPEALELHLASRLQSNFAHPQNGPVRRTLLSGGQKKHFLGNGGTGGCEARRFSAVPSSSFSSRTFRRNEMRLGNDVL
jgi:hypothetical protein